MGICPKCGSLARPNILMFEDGAFLEDYAQEERFTSWCRAVDHELLAPRAPKPSKQSSGDKTQKATATTSAAVATTSAAAATSTTIADSDSESGSDDDEPLPRVAIIEI